jgi:hypothetical protein
MSTQLSVTRGDNLGTQTVTLTSASLDYSNLSCTGELRKHPDSESTLYRFVPTISSATTGSAVVYFDLPGSVTKTLPPINLYGDIHFYSTGILDQTLFQFRLDVSPDVSHM